MLDLARMSLGIPCMQLIDENTDDSDFFDENKFDTYMPTGDRDLNLTTASTSCFTT
mgnify:CR=1 FL=1